MTLHIKDVLSQASAAYKKGQAEESIRILVNALEKGESTELYNALSISYRRTGNETRLAETLKKALLFDPKNLRACILEGAMHEQARKPRLALQSYSRAQAIARATPPHDPALQRDVKAVQTRIPVVMKTLEVETYQAFKALGDINLCKIEGGTPSILFSLLKPSTHIPPYTNMLSGQ